MFLISVLITLAGVEIHKRGGIFLGAEAKSRNQPAGKSSRKVRKGLPAGMLIGILAVGSALLYCGEVVGVDYSAGLAIEHLVGGVPQERHGAVGLGRLHYI